MLKSVDLFFCEKNLYRGTLKISNGNTSFFGRVAPFKEKLLHIIIEYGDRLRAVSLFNYIPTINIYIKMYEEKRACIWFKIF
jgi:hypothetical protein